MDHCQELKWEHLVETLRVLRGWGQEELAVAAGLDTATVAKQEQGLKRPSPESRRKIEEALGIEGWSREVEIYLAKLRERLVDPGRRSAVKEPEPAGAESSRLMQAALWMGLAELRGTEDGEPGLPWGVLIATLRTLRGWSQKELARRAGVDVSTVSRQELAKADPSEMVREKLEQALGLQGRTEPVRMEIGGLRAKMLAPRRRVVEAGIEQAGAKTARLVEGALRLALDDLLVGGLPFTY